MKRFINHITWGGRTPPVHLRKLAFREKTIAWEIPDLEHILAALGEKLFTKETIVLKIKVGVAICNKSDTFIKKIGSAIALSRLKECDLIIRAIHLPNPSTERDTTKLSGATQIDGYDVLVDIFINRETRFLRSEARIIWDQMPKKDLKCR